jgi:hypothetical protein
MGGIPTTTIASRERGDWPTQRATAVAEAISITDQDRLALRC